MSYATAVFTTRKGRKVRHVERHQDVRSDFWYLDTETGREFDVRELPEAYLGVDRADVCAGDLDAHRRVIRRAIDADFDFKRRT